MINGRKNRSVKTKNYIINVNCYTWINNSHGLFDYESENFYKKCFKIKCLYNYYYILKDDINVEIKNEEEINKIMLNNSSMKLICKIKYINNNYQLIPCIESKSEGSSTAGGTAVGEPHGSNNVVNRDNSEYGGDGEGNIGSNNVGNSDSNNARNSGDNRGGNSVLNDSRDDGDHGDSGGNDAENFWVIVKYLKNKSSILHEDDIIKLGRVKLKIKKIITNVQQEREYNKSLSPFDDDECETDIPEMVGLACNGPGDIGGGDTGHGVVPHRMPTPRMEHTTGDNALIDKNNPSNNYVSGSINPNVSLYSSQRQEDENICINCGAASNDVEDGYNLYDDVDEGDDVSDAVEGSELPRDGQSFLGRSTNSNIGEQNRPQESDINLAGNNSYVDDFYLVKGNVLNGELNGECRTGGGRGAQSKNRQNEDDVAVVSESPFRSVLSHPSNGKTQNGGGSLIDKHTTEASRARKQDSGAANRLLETKSNCSGAISEIDNDGGGTNSKRDKPEGGLNQSENAATDKHAALSNLEQPPYDSHGGHSSCSMSSPNLGNLTGEISSIRSNASRNNAPSGRAQRGGGDNTSNSSNNVVNFVHCSNQLGNINENEDGRSGSNNEDSFRFMRKRTTCMSMSCASKENVASTTDYENIQSKDMTQRNKGEGGTPSLYNCRICLCEYENENNPLISPCKCKGSMKYVHLNCIRTWMRGRLSIRSESSSYSFFWKQLNCELCKFPYPTYIFSQNRYLELYEIPKPELPYIIIELMNDRNRGFYIVSLANTKCVRMGRGHDTDVRVNDISVSRFHAMIKFCNGNFYIEDCKSKFGTLIQIRKPVFFNIRRNKFIALQVGRTVMYVYMKRKNWISLPICLKLSKTKDEDVSTLDNFSSKLIIDNNMQLENSNFEYNRDGEAESANYERANEVVENPMVDNPMVDNPMMDNPVADAGDASVLGDLGPEDLNVANTHNNSSAQNLNLDSTGSIENTTPSAPSGAPRNPDEAVKSTDPYGSGGVTNRAGNGASNGGGNSAGNSTHSSVSRNVVNGGVVPGYY
ncbi:hypothetical protein C922_01533 [Plasmodium inui San Antonio 1]|uniref:FHA domain-containing protein n=1 Tax=Plasmodium inui San Antonio 1 TaxID=1237626 RepID=W7AR30_9APIC|nr:hypothetical protein C922_01533 [Plasmodium inui San Antonio 1]EUD67921.1 hypothetical protein C922_01533 [Plasmodium inui San Antonio 1]